MAPFSAACAAVDLDAATIDEQSVRRILGSGECAEDAFPDAALVPANEAIVERLLRSIDVGAVRPAATASQRMNDSAQHASIVHARLAPHIRWQERFDPFPLRIGKPKEIRHLTALSSRQ
jgi:hypothetical protein